MAGDSIQKPEGFKYFARVSLALFVLCSAAQVVLRVLSLHSAAGLLKAVPMPLLLFYVLSQIFRHGGEMTAALCATGALALHCLGDVLLELGGGHAFAAGLAAFLLGHIAYLTYMIRKLGRLRFPENMVWMLAALLSVGIGFVLAPEGESLTFPLVLYSLALLCYVATGVAGLMKSVRTGRTDTASARSQSRAYCSILFGGLLFIASDFLIAYHRFLGGDFPQRSALIMGTYLLAEFLLATGVWMLSASGKEE